MLVHIQSALANAGSLHCLAKLALKQLDLASCSLLILLVGLLQPSFLNQLVVEVLDMLVHVLQMLQKRLSLLFKGVDTVIVHFLEILEVHILHPEILDLLLSLVDEILLLRKLLNHAFMLLLVVEQLVLQVAYLILGILQQPIKEIFPVAQSLILFREFRDLRPQLLSPRVLACQFLL